MRNVAAVAPGWTTTLGGTAATAGLLLRSVTITPLEAAGWSRVTVPSTCVVPPVTVLGFTVRVLILGGIRACGANRGSAAQPGLTARHATHMTNQGKILATFIDFPFRYR